MALLASGAAYLPQFNSLLVAETGAARMVFLGDFLRSTCSPAADALGALERWRTRHSG